MKKLSIISLTVVAGFMASMMVACGKTDTSATIVPATPVYGLLGLPYGAGNIGFYAQNALMQTQYPTSVGTTYNIQSAGMLNILKLAMGVCNRNNANGGLDNCTAWLSGYQDIMLFAQNDQATSVNLVLRAFPNTNCTNPSYCSYYSYTLPSFQQFFLGLFGFDTYNQAGMYNPMNLSMTIWPIENNAGFELRGYAPAGASYQGGSNLLFQFQVAQGNLDDLGFDFTLAYNGTVAATGHMLRCQSVNCGVQGY